MEDIKIGDTTYIKLGLEWTRDMQNRIIQFLQNEGYNKVKVEDVNKLANDGISKTAVCKVVAINDKSIHTYLGELTLSGFGETINLFKHIPFNN